MTQMTRDQLVKQLRGMAAQMNILTRELAKHDVEVTFDTLTIADIATPPIDLLHIDVRQRL